MKIKFTSIFIFLGTKCRCLCSWLKRAGSCLGTELIIDLFRCSSKFVNVMPLEKHHAVKKKKMVSINLPSNFL